MASTFIPAFHFEKPENKLTPEWCKLAKNFCVFNSNNRSLVEGKNVEEIEDYSSGVFSMIPFRRMFKSQRKAMEQPGARSVNGGINEQYLINTDTTGIDWTPLPLIPTKLNSAVSVVQKIPVEVECVAMDALAIKKKEADMVFLKNKPKIEEELQDIADQLDIGKVDLGSAKNGGGRYSSSPMGLDLTQPDEEDIFSKLIYALNVETSFEKALQQFYYIKKVDQIRLLETRDQFKFGISVNWCPKSAITYLPDIHYLYPDKVSTPESDLPDYADTTHRIIDQRITIMEMFNAFGDEIKDEKKLDEIINGTSGYCKCNKGVGGSSARIDTHLFDQAKVNLKYIEVRSIDYVGIGEKKGGRGAKYITSDEEQMVRKIWGQNTYGFWWLVNTDYFFGIHRLDGSYRTRGFESYQNWSTNIYKSQDKSAVELCIGENKKAQIADIKFQHALIMSLPAGKYIDLRFLRGAVSGLKDEKTKYTMQDLINLVFEKNQFIGDTQEFDGKADNQLKPFMEIPGGLKTEVQGYINTILTCSQNISSYTGINEQLTGQSANPEGLVGLQKLLINSSINALYYCNEAIRSQYQCIFNMWANIIQDAISRGGKTKQAIINMIGIDDTRIIDGLNEVPLHNLTIRVEIGQREEERQRYFEQLAFLKQKGIITTANEYVLSAINNNKERFAVLAVLEKKFQQKQDQIRREDYENSQQLMAKQGENQINAVAAESEGEIKSIYAKGDVQSKLMEHGNQLGLSKSQMDAVIKRILQKDRGDMQTDKAIKTIEAKAAAKEKEGLI